MFPKTAKISTGSPLSHRTVRLRRKAPGPTKAPTIKF